MDLAEAFHGIASRGQSEDELRSSLHESAAEITRLRAEVAELQADLSRANQLINAALDDYRGARSAGMERAAQIAYEMADERLRKWEDDSTSPETAVEHKACAEALHEAAEAIRQLPNRQASGGSGT